MSDEHVIIDRPMVTYSPLKEGVERFLGGPLEAAVMMGVWDKMGEEGYVGVNEVHEYILEYYGNLRYNTTAKILNRLAIEKGLLDIEEGRANAHKCLIFVPIHKTQSAFEMYMVRLILSSLLEQYKTKFIAWIIANVGEFMDLKVDGSVRKRKFDRKRRELR